MKSDMRLVAETLKDVMAQVKDIRLEAMPALVGRITPDRVDRLSDIFDRVTRMLSACVSEVCR